MVVSDPNILPRVTIDDIERVKPKPRLINEDIKCVRNFVGPLSGFFCRLMIVFLSSYVRPL